MVSVIRVLILDELSRVHTNYRSAIEHSPNFCTIGHADLAASADHERIVALLSLNYSRNEAALVRIATLCKDWPNVRVLVIFQSLQASEITGLIRAGVNAFLAQGMPASAICHVVAALANGTDLCPPTLCDANEAMNTLGLTRREAEILRFLSAGFSNKEVARRLSLSVRTVETHRLNLRRKTRSGRLKDLVTLAREARLSPVVDQKGSLTNIRQ